MNAYVASVIDYVKTTHANQPEFVQTVEEVLSSVSPIMDAHPEYEKVDLLKRMVEPERMFTFRVCWMDDKGHSEQMTFIPVICSKSWSSPASCEPPPVI